MNFKKIGIGFFIILGIALVSILIYRQFFHPALTPTQPEQKPSYWIDTMKPTIHYPGPGKSRMGMALVPVYAGNPSAKINQLCVFLRQS